RLRQEEVPTLWPGWTRGRKSMIWLVKLNSNLLVLASLVLAPILAQSQSMTNGESFRLRPLVAQEGGKPHHTAESTSDTLSVIVYKATRGDEGRFSRVGP